ncbi:hypothetical protein [Mangrovicoccus sp. HB161399]|uniref:hypothetical protein n=1 Tax=Mangrovicoccus sp. HB161399 TaxID=2720392 RepID=UPI0015559C1D|nr:hypothetical protein [Mangrovicoccus sp. HB161399]
MAILGLLAEFGEGGANGKVFLGGATALNMLGTTSATKSGNIPANWLKKLDTFIGCSSEGGTFRLAGTTIIREGFYVKAEGIVFKETEHGSKGPAYWELGDKTAKYPKTELAEMFRRILESPDWDCKDPWVATLVAAMFLSEVARNPRSFMVNLMLLDLLEGGVKYGKSQDKELDFGKLLQFGSGQPDKSATYSYGADKMKVGKGGESGTNRGGKLPMSHLGAMKNYEATAPSKVDYNARKFAQLAKQSSLNLKAPAEAGTAFHMPNALAEKECTILLRWLVARFSKKPPTFQIGSVEQKVEVENAWTKAKSVQIKSTPVHAAVTFTALREHLRKAEWSEAKADAARATVEGTLIAAATAELAARQNATANLLS